MALITTLYDLVMVMKIREDTFSANQGIVGATKDFLSVSVVVGMNGTTEFGIEGSDIEYRLNGVRYEEGDYQAPMNAWGIVHVRWKSGYAATDLEFGQVRNDLTFLQFPAFVDIAEIIATTAPQSMANMMELTEHLAIKWQTGV